LDIEENLGCMKELLEYNSVMRDYMKVLESVIDYSLEKKVNMMDLLGCKKEM
jgi:hypothetical protein